jgi:hypothetical protein
VTENLLFAQYFFLEVNTAVVHACIFGSISGGVWFEELKFNKHGSTFVLFNKKFPILD